jgi:hypothetical protein
MGQQDSNDSLKPGRKVLWLPNKRLALPPTPHEERMRAIGSIAAPSKSDPAYQLVMDSVMSLSARIRRRRRDTATTKRSRSYNARKAGDYLQAASVDAYDPSRNAKSSCLHQSVRSSSTTRQTL